MWMCYNSLLLPSCNYRLLWFTAATCYTQTVRLQDGLVSFPASVQGTEWHDRTSLSCQSAAYILSDLLVGLDGTRICHLSHVNFSVFTTIAAPPPRVFEGLGHEMNFNPLSSNILSISCWNLVFLVSWSHVSDAKHAVTCLSSRSVAKLRIFGAIERVFVAANTGNSELAAILLSALSVFLTPGRPGGRRE